MSPFELTKDTPYLALSGELWSVFYEYFNRNWSCYKGFLLFWSRCLTHWGWVTHICISKLTIIGSDNGLSPGRRQAIIWTNAQILLIVPLGTNFSEILTEIYKFSFKKMHLKMLYGKWQTSCLGLNVLDRHTISFPYGSNLECLSSVALHLEKIHNKARLVCIICKKAT